jgi:hypothetical protein
MDDPQFALLDFQFRKRADFQKAVEAGAVSFRALKFFLELGKIDSARLRRFSLRNFFIVAIWNQERRLDVEGVQIFAWFLREQSCGQQSKKKRGPAQHAEIISAVVY